MEDRRKAILNRPTEDERLLATPTDGESSIPESWQIFRIMSEFVEGFDILADAGPAVTIFGSARTKPENPQYQQCVATARLLGEAGYTIITGGGPGMMQAGNQGAHEAGALSVGLNIVLPFEQHINPYTDISMDFRYFFSRKTMLVKYAHAYVIFPGGFGTMDELFEALTLIQTGKVRNFPVVLFDSSYWGGLVDWLRSTMEKEGKISPGDIDLMFVTDSPEEARDYIIRCNSEDAPHLDAEKKAREAERAVRKAAK